MKSIYTNIFLMILSAIGFVVTFIYILIFGINNAIVICFFANFVALVASMLSYFTENMKNVKSKYDILTNAILICDACGRYCKEFKGSSDPNGVWACNKCLNQSKKRIGVIFRLKSFWMGLHYSSKNKRLCINLLPCVTIWIIGEDGVIPEKEQ